MRIGGAALFIIGLIAAVVCTMNGFNRFFGWNGRHPVEAYDLQIGENHQALKVHTGRRYTVAVKAIFDGRDAADNYGQAKVWAKMALVVRVTDAAGTKLADLSGWLDPEEQPNIFSTIPLHTRQPGGPHEISVERLVAPFTSSSDATVDVFVDLGPDRIQRSKITNQTLVIYDDALPASIRVSAIGAGASIVAALAGFVLLLKGWWKTRRKKKRPRTGEAPAVSL